ncbi:MULTISPECIES: carboxypeptidase-like regulatory domain-containing protein [unclassified Saccharicrinis]|uniref:carboxypeptidase-like regulatory domain-containing protein n=1 Tax=unclassified Saccharicrinis TaxID=2646859 RepID=UPI003D3450D1
MKRSIAISFILFFVLNSLLMAQNFTATGTVINAETGVAVEFANIGVESTYLGTASDSDGNFEIILSQALIDKQISVSAVGYKAKTYKVGEWSGKDGLMIQLTPVKYGISEVNVSAKSKIGYGIIRAASNLIVENYLTEPYSYNCYLRTVSINEGRKTEDEAIFVLTDSKGYGTRSFTEAFQNIHYRITESNPHKEIGLLKEGLTFIDNLISQDIVRNPGNILSVESINDFDVYVEGEEVLEEDSVWVISYECKNPTIQNTGDPQLVQYKGKIWISHQNNQVLKNSFEAVRTAKFRHGNSFYANKENSKLKYKVETAYKAHGNKMVLNSVNYIQNEANGTKTSVYLKVVKVDEYTDKITNRQYFNGSAKEEKFWDNFKLPE